MASKSNKELRCAIYTRKSTDHGLELEFNSLDAQREACEAYIKSQASEGWHALPKQYDDPAYSGGNLERPAVRRLLKDIEAGLIDVVVVYKIDRLTRSLTDFAKLVDVFDAKSVSFVAVTQQFNTTTSMGRLTLNVLLSFAQFERELASERVRDKVAASRKKGIWTGGSVPLGYANKDKKLIVHAAEAKTVRMIFERYLALRSFQKLVDELNKKGVVTKARGAGKMATGVSFTYGSLAYLLKNRTYRGETGFNGSWFPGEHEAIVPNAQFNKVQDLLKTNSQGRTGRRQQTGALLAGLLFDDRGNRMSPSFSVKRGIRYPYYVSSALLRGRKAQSGSVTRVSATDLEAAVLQAIRRHTEFHEEEVDRPPRHLLEQTVARIVIRDKRLAITLKATETTNSLPIEIPWTASNKNQGVQIEGDHLPDSPSPSNPHLLQAVIRAHMWHKLLIDGTHNSVDSLSRAVNLHPKVIRKGIRLAFLAPALTRAILQGEKSTAFTLAELDHPLPLSWNEQQNHVPQPA